MVSGGNPKYPAGTAVTLRAVSGHRDGTLTDCPGDAVYAQLPQIAQDAYAIGAPQDLRAGGERPRPRTPCASRATLSSSLTWTVRVLDAAGTTIASRSGTGARVAWTWDGRSAAGTPVAPGVAASWSIEAQDAAGTRALPATGGLLGTATPDVQGATSAVSVAPSSISPDGDGQADAATVTFSLAAPANVTVTVQDSIGTVLSTVMPPTAVAAGPVSLTWAGAAADPGTTVPDGAYRVVVTSTDAAGTATSASAPISVVRAASALTGPRSAISPNHDHRGDSATFRWTQLEPAHATLQIVSASAPLATVLDADLPVGPARAVWSGTSTAKLQSGTLGAVLTLTTEAGQQQLQTTFAIDLTPPTARGLQARTRAGGGFVRFRLTEPAYVQLRVQGHLIGGYVEHRAGVGRHPLPPCGSPGPPRRAAPARPRGQRGPCTSRPAAVAARCPIPRVTIPRTHPLLCGVRAGLVLREHLEHGREALELLARGSLGEVGLRGCRRRSRARRPRARPGARLRSSAPCG